MADWNCDVGISSCSRFAVSWNNCIHAGTQPTWSHLRQELCCAPGQRKVICKSDCCTMLQVCSRKALLAAQMHHPQAACAVVHFARRTGPTVFRRAVVNAVTQRHGIAHACQSGNTATAGCVGCMCRYWPRTHLSRLLLLAEHGRRQQPPGAQHTRRLLQRLCVVRHERQPVLAGDQVEAGGLSGN